MACLTNNKIEVYSLQKSTHEKIAAIEYPGHRSDIREVALSGDDSLLLTTSSGEY
jgi:hypothetical protein